MSSDPTNRARPEPPWADLVRAATGHDIGVLELAGLMASVDEWEAQRGEALVEQGHVCRQGFVVLSGTATVRADGVPIGRLAPGAAVWAADEPGARMPISVIADGRMWLLMVAPADQHLFRRTPVIS